MNFHITTDQLVALVNAVASFAIVLIGIFTYKKVDTVHVLMNSRLTELLAAEKGVSRAEGVAQERLARATETMEMAKTVKSAAAKVAETVVADAAKLAETTKQ